MKTCHFNINHEKYELVGVKKEGNFEISILKREKTGTLFYFSQFDLIRYKAKKNEIL